MWPFKKKEPKYCVNCEWFVKTLGSVDDPYAYSLATCVYKSKAKELRKLRWRKKSLFLVADGKLTSEQINNNEEARVEHTKRYAELERRDCILESFIFHTCGKRGRRYKLKTEKG